jgi:hypothetical protein
MILEVQKFLASADLIMDEAPTKFEVKFGRKKKWQLTPYKI